LAGCVEARACWSSGLGDGSDGGTLDDHFSLTCGALDDDIALKTIPLDDDITLSALALNDQGTLALNHDFFPSGFLSARAVSNGTERSQCKECVEDGGAQAHRS
jgi:hypothetical protein